MYALYESAFHGYIDKIWGWNDDWQINNFRKEWEEYSVEIIRDEHEMIGYIQPKRSPNQLFILNFVIGNQFQNRGVGSNILGEYLQASRTSGTPIALSVFKINERALTFYLHLGFEITGETKTTHQLEWSPS